MVLKFYMQHDQAAGLQNDKTQAGRQSKLVAVAKPLKSTFPPEHLMYLAEILYSYTLISEVSK